MLSVVPAALLPTGVLLPTRGLPLLRAAGPHLLPDSGLWPGSRGLSTGSLSWSRDPAATASSCHRILQLRLLPVAANQVRDSANRG
jgi:hypothetical protein